MAQTEIITRRRKWTPEEKAALLAEVEAEGGRVSVVARRHGISESLLYNWRSAWKAAARRARRSRCEFIPLGVVDRTSDARADAVACTGASPSRRERLGNERVWHDRDRAAERRSRSRRWLVNEKALSRVLRR